MDVSEWVRPANPGDRKAVERLLRSEGFEPEFVAREFAVCEIEGTVVACARARPIPEGGTEVTGVVVAATHRRRGLMRSLLGVVLLGQPHPVYALAPNADLATLPGFEAVAPSALPPSLRTRAEATGWVPTRLRRVALKPLPKEPTDEPQFLEG